MPDARLMRTGAGPRLLRAAVFTAVCVALSAAGHALASCEGIPFRALAAGFLAVFAVSAALAGRRRSLPAVTATLAGGQLALHSLFGLGQHGASAAAGASGPEATLAALAARLICGGNTVPLSPARAREVLDAAGIGPVAAAARAHADHAAAAASEPATALLSPPMLLGHLLAALAAGWLLHRGDAALGRLLRLSGEGSLVRPLRAALAYVHILRAGLPGAPPRLPGRQRYDRSPPGSPGREALQHAVIRRGPPADLALAA
jgi:hypothetical protein